MKYTKTELIRMIAETESQYPTVRFENPDNIYAVVSQYSLCEKELFILITANNDHVFIKTHIMTIGTATESCVSVREIIRQALLDDAIAIAIAHNHPSGALEPSAFDIAVTDRIAEACTFMDIRLLDHIIVSKEGFYSFVREGRLTENKALL